MSINSHNNTTLPHNIFNPQPLPPCRPWAPRQSLGRWDWINWIVLRLYTSTFFFSSSLSSPYPLWVADGRPVIGIIAANWAINRGQKGGGGIARFLYFIAHYSNLLIRPWGLGIGGILYSQH